MIVKLNLPYKQAKGVGPQRKTTQAIVIHATDNERADNKATKVDEAAENEASYATHRSDGIAAHVYIDDDSAVQAADLGAVVYGCHPTGNSRTVQLELAGRSNGLSKGTIARAAKLCAVICKRYAIPIVHINGAGLRARKRGICGHLDVTDAWHTGPDAGADHTDPGKDFPWPSFIAQVKAEYARLYGAKPAVVTARYVVRPGDTLSGIAAKHKTTVEALVRLNAIKNADVIHPGQSLRVR